VLSRALRAQNPARAKPAYHAPWPFGPRGSLFSAVFAPFWVGFGLFFGVWGLRPQTPSRRPVGPRGPPGPGPLGGLFLAVFWALFGVGFGPPGPDLGLWSLFSCWALRAQFGALKGVPFAALFGCFSGSWRVSCRFRLYSKVRRGPISGPGFGPYFACFSAVFGLSRPAPALLALTGPCLGPVFLVFGPFSALFRAPGASRPVFGFTARSFWALRALFRPFSRPPLGPEKRRRPVACPAPLGPQMYHFGPFPGPPGPKGPKPARAQPGSLGFSTFSPDFVGPSAQPKPAKNVEKPRLPGWARAGFWPFRARRAQAPKRAHLGPPRGPFGALFGLFAPFGALGGPVWPLWGPAAPK